MRNFTVMILLSCLLLLVSVYAVKPTDVFACSCAGPPTVPEGLERSAAVFAGKVTKMVGPKPKLVMSSTDPVVVTFEVTEVWKGELPLKTELTTAISSASCGYDQFAVGSEFLVFGYVRSGQLQTGLCDGTKLLSAAGKELTELGKGYSPQEIPKSGDTGENALPEEVPASEDQGAGQSPLLQPFLWGAAVVLAVVLMVYAWRKKREV
ncbi:hypothetical protein PVOR_30428 [Paenibacillus vortex V453]|uniref:Tissue inhibitor of metalloproteinase n=1 Tax=Paenibacillus vortex V453 TaxID=715225 RepID=A0A2R9SM22_9BACL|nr:hypothetical protein [Paenibacillus vortex]EFU38412.1 hypothetical protein PVOR_30428 [Paenibacillus vortex V453]